jgi:hypothetical protein
VDRFGIVTGTPPSWGYGYGAAGMVDPMLPGSFPLASYDPQLYGADSPAELEGYNLGSFTDTIQSIIGGVANAATNVENIARGISNASTATGMITQRAASQGGSLFQPSAADIAAKQVDIATLLGGNMTPIFLAGGALLLFLLLQRK